MELKKSKIRDVLCWLIIVLLVLPIIVVAKKKNKITVEIVAENIDKNLVESITNNLFVHSLKCNEDEWRVRHAVKKIDMELGESLNAYGYYNSSFMKQIEKQETCWNVKLDIELGTRTTIKTIDIDITGEAEQDQEFIQQLLILPVNEGDYLRHDKYESIKERIDALAQHRGYFDGEYKKHKLKVDKQNNSAEINLEYDSGVRYRFGSLNYEQNILTQELFEKYVVINENDIYLSSKIIKIYQDLSGSGYFADVEVKAHIDERQNGVVPIEINLLPAIRKSYSVGVGASTDTGPRLRFDHKNKRVNRHGHRYEAKLLLSPVISNISFDYNIPIGKPQTDFISLQIGAAHEDTDSAKSDSIKASVGRTKLRSNGWLENIFLEFLQEDFDVSDDDDTSSLLMPGISWAKTSSNHPIYPTRGYNLTLESRAAAQALISDVDLLRLKVNSKGILPLGEKARFLTRLEAGYNFVDNFEELPASLRFFAGGDNSIRGFEFKSLGPKGSDGDVAGGEGLLVGSVEVDYLFKPKWAIAAFIDAGNAFDANDIQLKQSAGIGVRWRSAIGPVKVDVAFPIDDEEEDDFRLHFSLGPEL